MKFKIAPFSSNKIYKTLHKPNRLIRATHQNKCFSYSTEDSGSLLMPHQFDKNKAAHIRVYWDDAYPAEFISHAIIQDDICLFGIPGGYKFARFIYKDNQYAYEQEGERKLFKVINTYRDESAAYHLIDRFFPGRLLPPCKNGIKDSLRWLNTIRDSFDHSDLTISYDVSSELFSISLSLFQNKDVNDHNRIDLYFNFEESGKGDIAHFKYKRNGRDPIAGFYSLGLTYPQYIQSIVDEFFVSLYSSISETVSHLDNYGSIFDIVKTHDMYLI